MDWIKISDKTPKEGQRVITYFEHTGRSIMEYHSLEGTKDAAFGENLFTSHSGFLTDDATHWMPLPSIPED